MPAFGVGIVADIWRELDAAQALTTVVITTQTGSSTDYTTGVITPTAPVVETVQALVGPFQPEEVDGLRITNLDRKVLIEAADLVTVPVVLSTVVFGGATWSMQAPPEPVSNDGLWQLHVRQVGQV